MLKRMILMFVVLGLLAPFAGAAPTTKGYAEVNGVRYYYEIHGRGEPLVMLHGGAAASEAFGPNIAALAKDHKVILVHLQGHGNTRDVPDRPFRFEQLADDVAAVAAHLKLAQVDVLGWSFGGNVSIQLAIRHPDLVRRLVVVSAVMKRDGWYPEVVAGFEAMAKDSKQVAAETAKGPLGKLYPQTNWEATFRKIGEAETRDYNWAKDVAALKMPVMLVFADADAVSAAHIVEMYQALGGGKRDPGVDGAKRAKALLAILPNTTHYDLMKTTAVAQAVAPFFK